MASTRLLDERGSVLVGNLVEARNPWTRTVGLLGRKSMNDDEGMLFKHCSSVHTYFMGMPIDVLFIDESWHVVRVVSALAAWHASHDASAVHVIELASGKAGRASIRPGALLRLS